MNTDPARVAVVIRPDGHLDTVVLPSDAAERLHELQSLVGGYIEAVPLPDKRYMILDENGKMRPHQINDMATAIAHEAEAIMPTDYIAGVAIVLAQAALQD